MQILNQLEAHEPGPLTVIGFGTRYMLDNYCLEASQRSLALTRAKLLNTEEPAC
jgi:hypothetical protein